MSHIPRNNYIFSANTVHSQIIVKGYKTHYNQNGIRLRIYQDKCSLILDTGNQSFTTTKTNWISSLVPSGCRPGNPIISQNYANSNTYICVTNDGTISKWSMSGSITASVWVEVSWNY